MRVRAMLTVVSAFTILVSAWLLTMFLILRHPGFEARTALSVLFVALGVATIVAVNLQRPARIVRAGVTLADAALAVLGAWIIAEDMMSAHFEGYVLPIGASFIIQGVLA